MTLEQFNEEIKSNILKKLFGDNPEATDIGYLDKLNKEEYKKEMLRIHSDPEAAKVYNALMQLRASFKNRDDEDKQEMSKAKQAMQARNKRIKGMTRARVTNRQ